jgi:SAM-dependent methyltransferase
MYSSFASEFSNTRIRPWPCVERFLSILPAGCTVLDAGCGNGRNLIAAKMAGHSVTGFDICPEFVAMCLKKELDVSLRDIETPITTKYDGILCIAVLHHLRTETQRRNALNQLYEALNTGGSLLLTLWSYETHDAKYPRVFEVGDNNVPWKSQHTPLQNDRYYYIYDRVHLDAFMYEFQASYPDAYVDISWEEQNWNIYIEKTA